MWNFELGKLRWKAVAIGAAAAIGASAFVAAPAQADPLPEPLQTVVDEIEAATGVPLDGLSADQLSALLDGLSGTQLTDILDDLLTALGLDGLSDLIDLGGLTDGQLSDLIGQLSSGDLTDLLGGTASVDDLLAQLDALSGGLDFDQLSSLLSADQLASLLDGLTTSCTTLSLSCLTGILGPQLGGAVDDLLDTTGLSSLLDVVDTDGLSVNDLLAQLGLGDADVSTLLDQLGITSISDLLSQLGFGSVQSLLDSLGLPDLVASLIDSDDLTSLVHDLGLDSLISGLDLTGLLGDLGVSNLVVALGVPDLIDSLDLSGLLGVLGADGLTGQDGTNGTDGSNGSNGTGGTSAAGITAAPTPGISGKPEFGQVLTTQTGTWDATSLSYQWFRNTSAISGATGSAYSIGVSDIGTQITVKVTGHKSGASDVTVTSAPTAKVTAAHFSKTVKPKITGTVVIGHKVKAKAKGYSKAITVSYQWFRNGHKIKAASAKHKTYKVSAKDRSKKLTVTMTYSKTGFVSVKKTSKAKVVH